MKVFNMTPHPVTVRLDDETEITYEPCGKVFRLVETDEPYGRDVDGVPVVKRSFAVSIAEFPELDDPDAVVIVSLPAALMLKSAQLNLRALIVASDTGSGAIRDEKGQIVAVRRFIVL